MKSSNGAQSTYICDECDREEIFPIATIWETVKSDYGWRVYKKGGCWEHACPDCVRAFAKGDLKTVRPKNVPKRKAFDIIIEALKSGGFSETESRMLIKNAQK